MRSKIKTISAASMARKMGVSSTYIRAMISRGVIKSCKKNASGHWEIDAGRAEEEILSGLSGRHRKKIDREKFDSKRRQDGGMSLAEAQRVKVNYQAALKKLEYDRKSGKLLPAEDVAHVWSDLVINAKTKLLAIPSKIAPIVADMDDPREVQKAVSVLIDEILNELAESAPENNGQ